jgi:hypothetical protein
MELAYGFLANAADVVQDGRFFVLGGGIDGIGVPAVPAVMPGLAILVNISFEQEECGEAHRFRVLLTNPEGNPAGPEFQLELRPRQSEPAYKDGATVSVAVSMIGLPFGHQGEYSFNLFVGDRLIGRIPFWVFIAPNPAGA